MAVKISLLSTSFSFLPLNITIDNVSVWNSVNTSIVSPIQVRFTMNYHEYSNVSLPSKRDEISQDSIVCAWKLLKNWRIKFVQGRSISCFWVHTQKSYWLFTKTYLLTHCMFLYEVEGKTYQARANFLNFEINIHWKYEIVLFRW